eukprot:366144_1
MYQAPNKSNKKDSIIELEEHNITTINGNDTHEPLLNIESEVQELSTTNILSGDQTDILQTVRTAIQIGYKKALSTSFTQSKPMKVFLSAMLSGSYLGFAITLTMSAMACGWDKISAALLFPFGFLLLVLSSNSLATGNFALLPMALLNHIINRNTMTQKNKITVTNICVNWLIVYSGNFVGALLCLFIIWGGNTHFNHRDEYEYLAFKESLCNTASHKTVTYFKTGGAAGWFASMFNGILANWLVTLAVLLSISSKSVIGKVIVVYLPISIFVALGFEHAIVNLFVLPGGLVYKCGTYTFVQWWVWNQIPVTMGNIVGGCTMTGIMYFAIHSHKL